MAESMRGVGLGHRSLESDRGVELAERQSCLFVCPEGHESQIVFSLTADIPEIWECKSCGLEAIRVVDGEQVELTGLVKEAPRSHYDMVLERRSRDELEELLAEMVDAMRIRRTSGKLSA